MEKAKRDLKLEQKMKQVAESFLDYIHRHFQVASLIKPHDEYYNYAETLSILPVGEIDWQKFDECLKKLASLHGVRASRYCGGYDEIIIIS